MQYFPIISMAIVYAALFNRRRTACTGVALIMYDVQFTFVHRTTYVAISITPRTLYRRSNVQRTLHPRCTSYIVQRTLYVVHCMVYVQCTSHCG